MVISRLSFSLLSLSLLSLSLSPSLSLHHHHHHHIPAALLRSHSSSPILHALPADDWDTAPQAFEELYDGETNPDLYQAVYSCHERLLIIKSHYAKIVQTSEELKAFLMNEQ